jgi:flavin reductase (DIM6/NTAB) family NADH-FMN oxidoreductase RutF
MRKYSKSDLDGMPKEYRRVFMNSVSGIKNCVLVGTKNQSGQSNLAIFNTCIHLGASPAMIGLLFRPITGKRHSYHNIKEIGFYTINTVHRSFYKQAHQTSAKYDENTSEFLATGLEEEFIHDFQAPFVKASLVKIGLKFEEEHHIRANDTILLCGKIELIIVDEDMIQPDGYVDLAQRDIVTVNGLDAYHAVDLIERLPYARP